MNSVEPGGATAAYSYATSASSEDLIWRVSRSGDPRLAGSLYGRGIAKLRKGDRSGGTYDINAAKQIKADIAEEFARYGLKP